jgi:filamentous hemagglutinin family protein
VNRSSLFLSRSAFIFTAVLASSISISAWADPTLPTGYDGSLSTGVTSVTNNHTTQTIVTDAGRSVGSFGNFSIGQGYTVNVNQPNAGASFLAVTRDASPSLIYGALNSNGAVWVANPNGVFVGPTGVISVAGFLGASQQISGSDFLNNTVKFNNLSGSVNNQGSITAPNYAILLGKNVSNSGVIESAKVALFAGKGVDVATTDGVVFRLNPQSALNTGLVNDNGSLYQHVVNNTGRIQAGSVSENEKGEVVLLAFNGLASNDGTIQATGGSVEVLGKTVSVAGTVDVSADSATVGNGGRIRIGGDFQGKGLTPTADTTIVSGVLKANGGSSGNAGTVVVWSNKDTSFTGRLLAAGGANGGNGGQAEISSKGLLGVSGYANVGAPKGQLGRILFDPFDLFFKTGGGVNTASSHYIDSNFVKTAVGNLDFQAQRNAFINNGFSRDNAGSFTLSAGNFIRVLDSIAVKGDINLNANGFISVRNNANVESTAFTRITSRQNIFIGFPDQTLTKVTGDSGVILTSKLLATIPTIEGAVTTLTGSDTRVINVWGEVSSKNGDVRAVADDHLHVFEKANILTPNGSIFLIGNADGKNGGTPENSFHVGRIIAGKDITLSNQQLQVGGFISANNGAVNLNATKASSLVDGTKFQGTLQGIDLNLNIGSGGLNLPNIDFVTVKGTAPSGSVLTDRDDLINSGLSGGEGFNITRFNEGVTANNENPEVPTVPGIVPVAPAALVAGDAQAGLRTTTLRTFAGPVSQRDRVSIQNNIGTTTVDVDDSTETAFPNNGLTPTTNGNSFLPTF